MLFFFIYVGYFSLNLFRTPPLDSVNLVTDRRAVLYTQPLNDPGPHPLAHLSVAEMSSIHGPLSDDVYDISPGLVSRVRYLYN